MNTDVRSVAPEAESPATRYLRSAKACRSRDLEHLSILGELVRDLSQLVHALQKERGATSVFLGSHGTQFAAHLAERVTECDARESAVRERLGHLDEKLDRISSGARLFARFAQAYKALDSLPKLRGQIASLRILPQDSVQAFTDVIGALLGVGFEVGDIAVDEQVSRALVALVNFAQAKEFAGQERATAAAVLSSGHIHESDRQRLKYLIAAQEQAMTIFTEFASRDFVDQLQQILASNDSAHVMRMRRLTASSWSGDTAPVSADQWHQHTTARIDALKCLEDRLGEHLRQICQDTLTAAREESVGLESPADAIRGGAVALVVSNAPSTLPQGIGLYSLDGGSPTPMRSILYVIQEQARRLDDVSAQLESARAALVERKAIERAKGLLMSTRRISEKDAYALMRDTAMKQNKRLVEIAETIISMASLLTP